MEYRGYEVIRSDDERLAEFYEAKANIFNLLENQYLIIKNEDGQDIDYYKIHNIASEAKQKLNEVRPTSIGQALRISGVNPADISILMVYLKKEYHHE